MFIASRSRFNVNSEPCTSDCSGTVVETPHRRFSPLKVGMFLRQNSGPLRSSGHKQATEEHATAAKIATQVNHATFSTRYLLCHRRIELTILSVDRVTTATPKRSFKTGSLTTPTSLEQPCTTPRTSYASPRPSLDLISSLTMFARSVGALREH